MVNRFVSKLSRYAELEPAEIAALEEATARPRKVAGKTDLIRAGDEPGPVLVMLDGWAMRYKILPNGSRQVMAFMMPGDACDLHVGLLTEMDHSIQTLTPSRVASIPGAVMEEMLDQHRGIARAMYVAQLVDEGTLRAWIVSMGRRSSIERVAHLICELYVRAHWHGLAGDEFEAPFPQLVLADALGMTPVHINRMLRDLRVEGIIALRRSFISIVQPVKLAKIAGFDENYLHRRLGRAG
jgi:CRP-like cAMP-binding protein